MKNKRDLGLVTSLSLDYKICLEKFLGNFDELMQKWLLSYSKNLKITFPCLYKPTHDVIITPVLSDFLNLETGNKEKKLLKI